LKYPDNEQLTMPTPRSVAASAALLAAALAIFIWVDILLPMAVAIALILLVEEFFKGRSKGDKPSRTARKPMQTYDVRINLQYEPAELKQILRYAKAHDVSQGGRYDIREPHRLDVWTHVWGNTACREESCLMFRLEFDLKTFTLMSVELMPGFDWQAFVDELAMLEREAVGQSIDGSTRHGPIT